jgi:hypothetical protein
MLRRSWTTEELLQLFERYQMEGPSQLAIDIGRSKDSVTSQARRFGLRKKRSPYLRRREPKSAIKSGTDDGMVLV